MTHTMSLDRADHPPIVPADAAPETIVDAVEPNWRAAVGAFGLASTTVVRDDPDLFWFITGLPDGSFNSIMYANLAPERVDAAIDELFRLRETYDVPVGWLVGPTSRPTDLPARLEARGLQRHVTLTPMTLALATAQVEPVPVPGLAIERVEDATTLDAWAVAEGRGFQSTGALGRGLAALRRGMGVGHGRPLYHLLGRLDGRPVATATYVLAAGIVGVFDVSTAPEARGRGIGTAMTVAALQAGRAAGYEIAFLQPSAMGRNLYERLGFRASFTCFGYG
jgi:GNAT superfamily N-acetyltransferase